MEEEGGKVGGGREMKCKVGGRKEESWEGRKRRWREEVEMKVEEQGEG